MLIGYEHDRNKDEILFVNLALMKCYSGVSCNLMNCVYGNRMSRQASTRTKTWYVRID